MNERKKTGFALGGAAAAARKANTPWRRHPHVKSAKNWERHQKMYPPNEEKSITPD